MNLKTVSQQRMNHFGYLKIFITLMVLTCVVFFSSKAGGFLMTTFIERASRPISASAAKSAQVIVVLTGGYWRNQEAARLHLATGLPVLASGGDREAAVIKKLLYRDFHITVQWIEENSLNTEENARYTAEILARENIQSIILVTHALHMWRAQKMFEGQGLEVIPAPTRFLTHAPLEWRDLLPSAEGRKLTQSALHEIFGLAWFKIRQVVG